MNRITDLTLIPFLTAGTYELDLPERTLNLLKKTFTVFPGSKDYHLIGKEQTPNILGVDKKSTMSVAGKVIFQDWIYTLKMYLDLDDENKVSYLSKSSPVSPYFVTNARSCVDMLLRFENKDPDSIEIRAEDTKYVVRLRTKVPLTDIARKAVEIASKGEIAEIKTHVTNLSTLRWYISNEASGYTVRLDSENKVFRVFLTKFEEKKQMGEILDKVRRMSMGSAITYKLSDLLYNMYYVRTQIQGAAPVQESWKVLIEKNNDRMIIVKIPAAKVENYK